MKRWNCKRVWNLRGRYSRKILRVSRWALLISFSVLYTYPWEGKALWLFMIIISAPGSCLFWREKWRVGSVVENLCFIHSTSSYISSLPSKAIWTIRMGLKTFLGKSQMLFTHLSFPFHVIPWPYLVGFGIYLKMGEMKNHIWKKSRCHKVVNKIVLRKQINPGLCKR